MVGQSPQLSLKGACRMKPGTHALFEAKYVYCSLLLILLK